MLLMKYRTRIYNSEADKALMWDRWQAGDSLHEIARLFDRPRFAGWFVPRAISSAGTEKQKTPLGGTGFSVWYRIKGVAR